MLNGDLFLKNQATAKKRRSQPTRSDIYETDASFHFIAFVPVDGKVWKLDGLERQPQSLGRHLVQEIVFFILTNCATAKDSLTVMIG